MNGEYERLRQLLLEHERSRLDDLHDDVRAASERFQRVPDLLAEDIEANLRQGKRSRLAHVLSEATADSLEMAVRRKPQAVVQAVYPVIGPAIRRALADALRQMADDFDRALGDALSPRALRWRWQAWRSGTPYAQVVLRHTTRYQVEHLFLISPESGLLLGHLTADGLPPLDADAVAGMFTAIQQFVRDSVAVEGEGGIGSATVGGYRLAVSEGPQARLVAFVRGVPSSDFGTRVDQLNEELHARHGAGLADLRQMGAAGAGLLQPAQLDELHRREAAHGLATPHGQRHWLLWLVLSLAVAALVLFGVSRWRWSSQVQAIGAHLSATPGVVVSSMEEAGRGKLRVEGLRDPLAADPRPWLALHFPHTEVDLRLRPFVSLEPVLLQRRVAGILRLPQAMVGAPDANGSMRITGSLPFPDWYRVRATALSTPGVSGVDFDGLSYPEQQRIDAAIARIEGLDIAFRSGAVVPEAGWEDTLNRLLEQLQALERLGAESRIAFHLQTAGSTDTPGTLDQNRGLRQQRAEWLASRLAAGLHPPSTIAVDQDAAFALPQGRRARTAGVTVTPYPAPAAAP